MDVTLQAIILFVGLLTVAVSVRRTGDWINPVTLLFICFFVPMFFAMFRLSGLQNSRWHYNTYLAILTSIGAWMIYPALLLAFGNFRDAATQRKPLAYLELLHSPYFLALARTFGIVVVAAYAVSNYIQAGNVLAFRNAEAAFQIHTVFPFGLRFLARAGVAGVVLLYAAYWARRRKLDLLLLSFVLAVPLSRLSRIDVAMGVAAIALMFSTLPLFKLTFRNGLLILGIFALLIFAGVELGSLRQNRFDRYDFKYSDFIAWRPDWTGPVEILPILYGYFALPFENLDLFVRQFSGNFGIALISFDWLFTGFLKLNWFTKYAFAQADNFEFTPVSSAANVPSALTPFYSDLGPVGMALPMMLYVTFWIYLYRRSKHSARSLLVYATYSGAFALVTFQALISAPFIVFQLVEIVAIFGIVRLLETVRSRRRAVHMRWEAVVARFASR